MKNQAIGLDETKAEIDRLQKRIDFLFSTGWDDQARELAVERDRLVNKIGLDPRERLAQRI